MRKFQNASTKFCRLGVLHDKIPTLLVLSSPGSGYSSLLALLVLPVPDERCRIDGITCPGRNMSTLFEGFLLQSNNAVNGKTNRYVSAVTSHGCGICALFEWTSLTPDTHIAY